MTKYFIFLRGINVGGNNIIRMEDLKQMFVEMGFATARTYIASGNVIIESKEKSAEKLAAKISKDLAKRLGYEVLVFMRSLAELEQMIATAPFADKDKTDKEAKLYATFLLDEPPADIVLPMAANGEYDLLGFGDRVLYSVSRRMADGSFSDPVTPVEKLFKKRSTSRNWNTICKIIR